MTRTSMLRNACRILLYAAAFCAVLAAAGESSAKLDLALRSLISEDPNVRGKALYEVLALGNWEGQAPRGIARLLLSHPEQAERIKTALIDALERQSEYFASAKRQGLSLTESDSEVWANLVWSVSSLRDPRAVKGLLGAINTGGMATGGLADLGPYAVDAVVERSREADAEVRCSAIQVLGGFLTRQEAVRSNPEAAAKAKAAILVALEDSEPRVRRVAASSSLALKDDPEIRVKLQLMAASDPEGTWGADGKPRFLVRDAATQMLSAKEADFYYVMRTPDTRECRIQKATESPAGISFLGPLTSASIAKDVMCSHIDDTGTDRSLCSSVQPKNACRQ
jgi:hypothetical protein